jgi:hypothetical protein
MGMTLPSDAAPPTKPHDENSHRQANADASKKIKQSNDFISIYFSKNTFIYQEIFFLFFSKGVYFIWSGMLAKNSLFVLKGGNSFARK